MFHKISAPLLWKVFWFRSLSSGNSNSASLSFKILALEILFFLEFLTTFHGGYGYFLEPHNDIIIICDELVATATVSNNNNNYYYYYYLKY